MTSNTLDRQTGFLLWLLGGWIGAHRFYAGHISSGLWMGGLFLGGFVLPNVLMMMFMAIGVAGLFSGGLFAAIAGGIGAGFMYLLGFLVTFVILAIWFVWWLRDLANLDQILGLAPAGHAGDAGQAEYVEPYRRDATARQQAKPKVIEAPFKRLPGK